MPPRADSAPEARITPGSTPSDSKKSPIPGIVLVLSVGVIWLVLLAFEVWGVNGPEYWTWPWRNLGWGRTLLLMAPPLVLLFAGLPLGGNPLSRKGLHFSLATLCLTNLALQVLGMMLEPGGLAHIRTIVESPVATNYFGEALRIDSVRDFLIEFPRRTHGIHSGSHPPGTILYYLFWIRLLGPDAASIVGGLVLGIVGSLGVPAIYGFSSLWTRDPRTRLLISGLYSLLPALVLFLPEFDQVFPLLAMGLVWGSVRALEGHGRWAILTGALLFLATLLAYNLLILGAFAALFALRTLFRGDPGRGRLLLARDLVTQGALVLGTTLLLHVLLGLVSGYNPVAYFQAALRHQEGIDSFYVCPYFQTLFFGPYDFFLGSGMLTLPLLFLYLRSLRGEATTLTPDHAAMTFLGLATIACVSLSATLPTETARLWLFLQPLVIVPAGIVLSRWPVWAVQATFVLYWAILAATKAKLLFINP
jgi:hypothetical protein